MSSSDADFKALEQRLGHVFSNKRLLDRALTHRSAGALAEGSYERLEFLGDRVLGLIVADMLLQRFPKDPEGHLSRRFNALVRRETLADVARDLNLGGEIRFGQYEEADGADNPAILSDVCEALIAAMYRDAGLEAARTFILRNWKPIQPRRAMENLRCRNGPWRVDLVCRIMKRSRAADRIMPRSLPCG